MERDLEVLALGQAPSAGVQRGIIQNPEEAAYSIKAAFEDAGIEGRFRNAKVYAGIGGKHVVSVNTSGEAVISRNDGLVTERDVARAIEASKSLRLAPEVEPLHHLPRSFYVDSMRCRRSPIGMRGVSARAEMHTVTAPASAVANLKKAVKIAGRDVDWVVSNAIVASQAVLTREETEIGVLYIDIGAGATDIAAYDGGAICHTSSLPVGGNQIVTDLAAVLHAPAYVCESLLRERANGDPKAYKVDDEMLVPAFGVPGQRRVRLGYINDIIAMRLSEILQMAVARAKEAAPALSLSGGLVIAGGVARMPALDILAERVTNHPVRIGHIPVRTLRTEIGQDPAFASLLSVLLAQADPQFAALREQRPAHQGMRRLLPIFGGARS
jgi:cell division protein FtsA